MTKSKETKTKAIEKSFSWRLLASSSTFLIVYISSSLVGSDDAATLASIIASIEVPTKIGLYYIHERIWARF